MKVIPDFGQEIKGLCEDRKMAFVFDRKEYVFQLATEPVRTALEIRRCRTEYD